MEHHDPDTNTPLSRDDLLLRLRDAMSDLDWRNLQVAERLLSSHALTLPQAAVLSVLYREGPDLEMSRIASRTGLPPSTITSIMDRLSRRQLVERRHHPADRRRVTGSITADGQAVVTALDEQRRMFLRQLLSDFSDEELGLLWKMIQRWTAISEEIIAAP